METTTLREKVSKIIVALDGEGTITPIEALDRIMSLMSEAEARGKAIVVEAVRKSCINECRSPDRNECAKRFQQEGKDLFLFLP